MKTILNIKLIFNSRIRDILLLILYKFSFDLTYVINISPSYDYYGFTLDFNVLKYILLTSFFLLLIKPTIALYYSTKTSSIAILLFTLMYFIPGLTYLSFIDVNFAYIIFYLTYWVLMLFWNRYMVKIKIPRLKKNNAVLFLILYVFFTFTIVLYISAKYTGFRLHFDLSDVYSLRAEARAMNFSTIIKYLMPTFAITIPVFIIYFLIIKKKMLAWILIFLQFLLFGVGGHKSYLFSLFVTILIYFFYKKERIVYISLGFLSLNIIVLFEGIFRNGKSILASFIQFRVQLLPNQISYYIYDFMQNHEFLYLRESLLRFFGFKSPYNESLFFIIGKEYYHNDFTRANNGMCGDAYAQFGFTSIFLYTLLIPIAFNLLRIFSRGLDNRIIFLVVFLYVSTFINGSFFSVFLTNGLIITYAILYLMSSRLVKNKSH